MIQNVMWENRCKKTIRRLYRRKDYIVP